MILNEAPYFIKTFVEELDSSVKQHHPEAGLSFIQKKWLAFCIAGVLMVNAVSWSKFERASLGGYKAAALSWIFRKGKIFWNKLLYGSVKLILEKYNIKEGVLAVDELDRARSKKTKRIHNTYKLKDKKTGGYVNGQTVVMLVLVANSITFPVGFAFYMPDPKVTAWKKRTSSCESLVFEKKTGLLNLPTTRNIHPNLK